MKIASVPDFPKLQGSNSSDKLDICVVRLHSKRVKCSEAMDVKFCEKEANRLFQYFQQNLPYGIYQRLLSRMIERDKLIREA